LARGLITGDADLAAPALRQEVFQYIFNTLRPDPDGLAKNYIVEYSDLVHAYIPSGTNAFEATGQVKIDAYLGARVFGLAVRPVTDDFGINWRTWTKSGRLLVGDNLYLADTLIDEFVTESYVTGGQLALDYQWDNGVEVWVNGVQYSNDVSDYVYGTNIFGNKSSTDVIKRGNNTKVIEPVGVKVQLFDAGADITGVNTTTTTTSDTTTTMEEIEDGVYVPKITTTNKPTTVVTGVNYALGNTDNGKVGKVVITYESLAQIKKIDSNAKTIDFDVFDFADNGTVKNVHYKNVATDDTFAVNAYVLIIIRTLDDDPYDYDKGVNKETGNAADVLRIAEATTIERTISNFTRANVDRDYTVLATVTADGEKIFVDSLYKFGRGDTPSFDNPTALILDSNGYVIGWDGDVVSAASLDYLYVKQALVYDGTDPFYPASVRLAVTYGKTGVSDIVTLPLRKSSPATVTVNGVSKEVHGNAAYDNTFIGWYAYTIDADKNVKLSKGAGSGPIVTGSAASPTFDVGSISAGFGTFPRDIDGGFVSNSVNPPISYVANVPARGDSTTVMYYNGAKYTGYVTFPYSTSAWTDPGKALLIRDKLNVTAVIFALGNELPAVAPSTFAVIKTLPYQATYRPDAVNYEVQGNTAAISEAYEPDATVNDFTYNLGDVVNVERQDDGTYKILGLRKTATNWSRTTVSYANPYDRLFTVDTFPGVALPAPPGGTTVTMTATTPFFDAFAAKYATGSNGIEARAFPKLGDVVEIFYNSTTYAYEAVVIVAHGNTDDVAANTALAAASKNQQIAYNTIKNSLVALNFTTFAYETVAIPADGTAASNLTALTDVNWSGTTVFSAGTTATYTAAAIRADENALITVIKGLSLYSGWADSNITYDITGITVNSNPVSGTPGGSIDFIIEVKGTGVYGNQLPNLNLILRVGTLDIT
jgi:hypothetical protein